MNLSKAAGKNAVRGLSANGGGSAPVPQALAAQGSLVASHDEVQIRVCIVSKLAGPQERRHERLELAQRTTLRH